MRSHELPRGLHVFSKQALHDVRSFARELVVEPAACGRCEARVNGAYAPIAADEERCRPGVQAFGLGDFRLELARLAGEQVGVLDS